MKSPLAVPRIGLRGTVARDFRNWKIANGCSHEVEFLLYTGREVKTMSLMAMVLLLGQTQIEICV